MSPLPRASGPFAVAGAALLATAAASGGQEADTLSSFDFREADLRVVLTALAEAADLTIVHSGLPSADVTLRTARPVGPSAVRRLLENVAEVNGVEVREEDGVVFLRPGAPREEEVAQEEAPRLRLFAHELNHVHAESVVRTLRALFGLGGEIPVAPEDERRGYSRAERLREAAETGYRATLPDPDAERPPDRPTGEPDESEGEQAPGMEARLAGPVQLVPDTRNNAILVLSTPQDFATIQEAIQQLDVRPLQVLIEAVVVEVRRDEDFHLSVGAAVPPDDEGEGVSADLRGALSLDTPGEVALQVLGIGGRGAEVVVRALAEEADVRILSRPAVLAQNNREARILVGEERPFTQLFRALPTDQSIQDRVVTFRPVGTELVITPTINRDGFVNLHVLQMISNATAQVQFGAPVIDTREAETQVLVRDGHTAVLGGLVDRQQEARRSGIPLLKDIPVLGALFGTTTTTDVATELFILLTPHVIRTDDDLEEAVESVREREAIREELERSVPILPPRDLDSLPLRDSIRPDTLRPRR